jgi:prepilin-type N-terminal cleavage/methylation domain-containing protein
LKRKGFTLIELMVVIAIIIILAAIAIPNYLNMTARAKKSRVQSDMASIATALETYKTDWGTYPVVAKSSANAVDDDTSVIFMALAGPETLTSQTAGTGADLNKSPNKNSIGEAAPINYMKAGTLHSIIDPILSGAKVYYYSDGTTWTLYAADAGTAASPTSYMYRTDGMSTPSESSSIP